MTTTSSLDGRIRRQLSQIAVPITMLLLTACGDKEAPAPAHELQLAEAREATEHERAARRVAEGRLGTVLWLSVAVAGGALALGLAVGSSRNRREVAGPNQSPSAVMRPVDGGANE